MYLYFISKGMCMKLRYLLLVGLLLLVFSASVYARSDNMVRYFDMNQHTFVGNDSAFSEGTADGEDIGTFTDESGDCIIGTCVYTDGTDNGLNSTYTLPATDEFTITSWLKPDQTTSLRVWFSFYLTGEIGRGYLKSNNGNSALNKTELWSNDDTAVFVTSESYYEQWLMWTLTRNTTGVYFYINDTLINFSATDDSYLQIPLFLFLGNDGTSNDYKGYFDDTTIYERALTPLEITRKYNGGAGLDDSEPLIIYVNSSHAACSDSYTRLEASDANTPLCDAKVALSLMETGDKIKEIGHDFFVSDLTGSDSNNGTDSAHPFKSLSMLENFVIDNNNIYYLDSLNINSTVDLNYSLNTGNVVFSPSGDANLTSCSFITWTALTGYNVSNTWHGTLSGLATNYPLLYDMRNHSEYITHRCWNSTVGISGSCSYDTAFTERPIYYQSWANSATDEIRVQIPNGEDPNTFPLCIAKDYGIISINGNDGTGNVTVEGNKFYFHKNAITPVNSDGVIIKDNNFDEGYSAIHIYGSDARGGTTITNNNCTGHNPLPFYNELIKDAYEESDCIKTNNDLVSPYLIFENDFWNTTGSISATTDFGAQACGSLVYNNRIHNDNYGFSSQLELEAVACNTSWLNNSVNGGRYGVSFGGLNCTTGNGTCFFSNNTVALDESILETETISYDTYAIKAYYANGANVANLIVSQNTLYAKAKCWNGLNKGVDIYNTTFIDNICVGYNSASSMVYGTGTDDNGNYWNNNAYYKGLGVGNLFCYWNNGTSNCYTSLANALAGDDANGIWDINSVEHNPEFVDAANYDFTPGYLPLCTASSAGSYVGAVPCSSPNNAPAVPNLIYIINDTTIKNSSTIGLIFNSTDGENDTITYYGYINQVLNFTTENTTFTQVYADGTYNLTLKAGDGLTNSSLSGVYQFTVKAQRTWVYKFDVKPYVLTANTTINYSNIEGLPTILDADSISYSNMASPSNTNDNDYDTGGGGNAGYSTLTQTFYALNYSFNQSKLQIKFYGTSSGDYAQMSCYDYNAGANTPVTTLVGTGSIFFGNITLPSVCTEEGENLVIYFYIHTNAGQNSIIYETELFALNDSVYTLDVEGQNIMTNYNLTDSQVFVDFTEEARAALEDDNQVNLTEWSLRDLDFDIINTSFDVVFNKSINVSITSNLTGEYLNATCTYNSATLYPLEELVPYNSTLENILRCTHPNYYNLTAYLTPEVDQYNFSMNSSFVYIILIDERTGEVFDVANLTRAVVYNEFNTSSFDFIAAGNSSYGNFSTVISDKLRFEFGYSDGTLITRYVDVDLIESPMRICVNIEGVTHYEQLLTSSQVKPVVMLNVYANCIIVADYTRFAYQDAQVLKAYTIQSSYYLYVWDNDDITDQQILLSSIDGSIATYINLDSLEFARDGYNIGITDDAAFVNKRNDNEMNIYYLNLRNDNIALHMEIERTDTGDILLNTSSFTDPNEVSLIFNFATLAVNDTTLFKLTITKTTEDGTGELIKYFNTSGVTGSLDSRVIVIVCILLIIFGLTFAASNTSLGWFGLVIMVINIGIASMAQAAWYVTFIQVINVIVLIFIGLVLSGKNQATIGS